jgi:hypothetical protein
MSDESLGDGISTRAYEALRRVVGIFSRSKAWNVPGFIVSHRHVMRRIAERERRLEAAKQANRRDEVEVGKGVLRRNVGAAKRSAP